MYLIDFQQKSVQLKYFFKLLIIHKLQITNIVILSKSKPILQCED